MSTQDARSQEGVTPTGNENEGNNILEDLLSVGNLAQLENIQKDRCLLRRGTRLAQNKQYTLGSEDKQKAAEEMCEDDEMKISIDRSTKTIHNHVDKIDDDGDDDVPTPLPTVLPWWLIVMALLPLILLLAVLLGWWLSQQPEPTTPPQTPVVWELDIGVEDPEEASPAAALSGIDRLRERNSVGENADD